MLSLIVPPLYASQSAGLVVGSSLSRRMDNVSAITPGVTDGSGGLGHTVSGVELVIVGLPSASEVHQEATVPRPALAPRFDGSRWSQAGRHLKRCAHRGGYTMGRCATTPHTTNRCLRMRQACARCLVPQVRGLWAGLHWQPSVPT